MKKSDMLIIRICAFTVLIGVISIIISLVFHKPVTGVVFGITGVFTCWITTVIILSIIIKK